MGSAHKRTGQTLIDNWISPDALAGTPSVAQHTGRTAKLLRTLLHRRTRADLSDDTMPKASQISTKARELLLTTLSSRFEAHMHRHTGMAWSDVRARLDAHSAKLSSLQAMEESGGEPDVVGLDASTGEYLFVDCATQSPKGRRSVCYDRKALDARKENKPKNCAMDMVAAMGCTMLTEDEYRRLQNLEPFDTTTSSWVQTPDTVRALGGALFCDRRYDTVFVYHNGAESYYAARGFRCMLRV
jgi:Protein of unknown function (DUF4256)